MPASIFAGSKVKTLKSTLSLNGGADIISSSTTNPQTSAVSAEPGSLLLNTTSGTMYRKLDAGLTTNWVEVGAGSGGKNYIKNPDFDGGATTSWSMQKVSLSSLVPTGNIGAADAGHTIATSSSSPLEGANSLLVQGASAFTAGNCLVSEAFAIDREDQAKVMGWSFYYEAVTSNMDFSGTSAGTWAVYIAEVTTATPDTVVSWIQPAGVYNLVQSSGAGIASGTFQTTATGTAYRLVLVCINSEAAATTLKVDDFQLGPQKVLAGAAISDWQNYTPGTISGFSSSPTVSIARYRRVGSNIEVQLKFTFTSASNDYIRIPGPTGFTIDAANSATCGTAVYYVGDTENYTGAVVQDSAGRFLISDADGSSWWNGSLSSPRASTASGHQIFATFSYPVVGLSSNTVMSQDTDTRVVAFSTKSVTSGTYTQTANGTFQNLPAGFWGTPLVNTHGTWDSATNGGEYIIPVSGIYKIQVQAGFAVSSVGVRTGRILIDGSEITRASDVTVTASSTPAPLVYCVIQLNAGQKIRAQFYQNSGGNLDYYVLNNGTYNIFTVERLSGPATIAASEFVGASFKDSTTTLSSGGATLVFPSAGKVYDSHGGMNTSTGIYTVPVSGKYSLSCFLLTTQTTGTSSITLNAFQTGSDARSVELQRLDIKTGLTSNNGRKLLQGDATFNCLAGDTLYVVGYDSDATSAIAGTRLSITRIG